MDHLYQGGYRFLELYSFNAPNSRQDKQTIEQFYQGTIVLRHIIKMVNATYKQQRQIDVPLASMYVDVVKGDLVEHLK